MPRNRSEFPDNKVLVDAKRNYNFALQSLRTYAAKVIADRKAIIEIEEKYEGPTTDHLEAVLQHLFLARTFKGEEDIAKANNPFRNGSKPVTVSV